MNDFLSSKIACVYHFFPHYRSGFVKKAKDSFDITFFGAPEGIDGINILEFDDDIYKSTKTYYYGKFVVQPSVVWLSIFGGYSSYIFLANPNFLTTWIAAFICRLRGRKVIFWGHGFKSNKRSPRNYLRKIFFKLASVFYSYGWRAKINAVQMGFDANKIYVGFNSLDYDHQLNLREKLLKSALGVSETNHSLRILCISRLTKICRYDVLFEAIALAGIKYAMKVHVTVIGDGPEMASLKARALLLGIDVEFIGALYDEEQIATHLYRSDVTVSPGKVGLTAMHSMMYGTPVISHDDFENQMPEVEAIVPCYTGLFFEKDSVADLTEKLRDFKVNFPDRELTRQRCFLMIDKVYNPAKQVAILTMAIQGISAPLGNDAFALFGEGENT
ncbi:MAG: glycosyltransferase [Rhodoferax sp.]|jgi:glycosyltransferase involved in cell wall biosynthesis|nr:glycosyltransferase [Rhodoferax sp.]